MSAQGVRKVLLEGEQFRCEIRLNDGTRILVPGRESWMVGDLCLVVQDSKREMHHIAYRNITSIRYLTKNGRR